MLVVAYDGTNYSGWQRQDNAVSVQSVIEEALSEICKFKVEIEGASRTDAGVHAYGNVAIFDTEMRMSANAFAYALNTKLPDDIKIQYSCEVPGDWHPRKTESIKTYVYRILNRAMPMPTDRLYSYFCYHDIDVEKMRKAAGYFIGTHDFKSFCSSKAQVKSTVRTVYSIDIIENGDMIEIYIRGNGFLYNMVRIISGTLLAVGKNKIEPVEVKNIIESKNREMAGDTLPANGLTLFEIEYPELEI